VPHQLFSSGGVITPLVKGMLGFYPDAPSRRVRLEPHLPSRWDAVEVRNLKVGAGSLAVDAARASAAAQFRVRSSGLAGYTLDFSPGFEPGARVRSVSVNSRTLRCQPEPAPDAHCSVSVTLTGNDVICYDLTPGLRVMEPADDPSPGERTSALKIIRLLYDAESDSYTLDAEGRSGRAYSLRAVLPGASASVEGATLQGETLTVEFPSSAQEYVPARVVIRPSR